MLLVSIRILVFATIVDESFGCGPVSAWLFGKRDTADAGSVHWTFGACFEHEQACLEERYNIGNITQITGIELASLYPGSFDFAILEGLVLPSVGSMNCHELCNCLSCGHGHCSDEEDQDKCPGNKYGFICRCSNSPSYPNLKAIVSDMLSSGNACRHCSN